MIPVWTQRARRRMVTVTSPGPAIITESRPLARPLARPLLIPRHWSWHHCCPHHLASPGYILITCQLLAPGSWSLTALAGGSSLCAPCQSSPGPGHPPQHHGVIVWRTWKKKWRFEPNKDQEKRVIWRLRFVVINLNYLIRPIFVGRYLLKYVENTA